MTAEPTGRGASARAAHQHGVSKDADRRYLGAALILIVALMVLEVVVGLIASSLALLSDAEHMLTDAKAIGLALIAMRLAARPAKGAYTYGLKRAEILSAQANGITLLLLVAYFLYEAIRRLVDPPEVSGGLVLVTALVGIAVNVVAAWLLSKANRSSLNIEGAFQHILNDLYAFIATAVAGLVVVLGFTRADAISGKSPPDPSAAGLHPGGQQPRLPRAPLSRRGTARRQLRHSSHHPPSRAPRRPRPGVNPDPTTPSPSRPRTHRASLIRPTT